MEIRNGEYIRTNDGYMGKVTRFTTSDICYVKFYDNEEWKTDIEEAGIVKHSFNIAEILEEGDYVNGYKVIEIQAQYVRMNGNHDYIVKLANRTGISSGQIKSIVTKEQFKAMEYEVK